MDVLEQNLPIKVEGLGNIRDISSGNNFVLFEMRIQENEAYGINVNKISSNHLIAEEIISTQISIMKSQMKDALNNIAKQNFKIKVIINGSNSNQGIIVLSPIQIESAINTNNKISDYEFSLKMTSLTTKIMLPIQVDKITTWIDTQMTSSTFEYIYLIDDLEIDINNINMNVIKHERIESLRQNLDIMDKVIKCCLATNRNLIYKYICKQSNKTVCVVLTYTDLKNLTN